MKQGSRNFLLVLNTLTTKGSKYAEALYHFLAASQTIAQDLPCFFQVATATSDPSQKQRIFEAALNVIALVDFKGLGFAQNSAIELLKCLGDFPIVLPTIGGYFLFAKAVRKLCESFDVGSRAGETIQQSLMNRTGKNNGFVLAVLSERYDFLRQRCLDTVMGAFNMSDYLQILELAFALRYANSSSVQNPSFMIDKVATIVQQAETATVVPLKQSCVLLLATAMHYFPVSEAMGLFTSEMVVTLQGLLDKDYAARKVVFELADGMPASDDNTSFSVKAQLTSLLPQLTAAVRREEESEFMPKLISFASKRKSSEIYPMTIAILPSTAATYRSGVLLAAATGDLKSMLIEYYPTKFDETLGGLIVENIPVVAKATPQVLSHENVEIVCKFLMSALCVPNLAASKERADMFAQALTSLTPFASELLDQFLVVVSRIAASSSLLMMCSYFLNNIRSVSLPGRDYGRDYCRCVGTLIRFIAASSCSEGNKKIFLDFLAFVSQRYISSNEQVSLPMSVHRLINHFVPSNLVGDFAEQCLELFKSDPSYAICCAGLPNLTTGTVLSLVDSVNGRLKLDEFVLFYSTRAHVNSGEAIGHMHVFAKKIRGSGLSGLFKKSSPLAIQCVIQGLTLITQEIRLSESEVKSILDMTKRMLPKNNEEMAMLSNDGARLIEALAKRQEIRIPSKLIDEWLKVPAYVDTLPYLLLQIPPSDARVAASSKAWALHISGSPADSQRTKDITEALLKFRDQESTLDMILNAITPCLYSESDPLEILKFALEVASAARRKMWKYTANSMSLLGICALYCLSAKQEVRVTATQLIMNLFVIPDGHEELKHFRSPLSSWETKVVFLILYGLVFKQIPGRECLPLFEKCVTANPLQYHHVLIMRALLAAHGDDFVEHQVAPLVKMCALRQGKTDPQIMLQVEIALLSFASLKPTAFMRFLCATAMNDLTTNVIVRLMMKEELRQTFINEYLNIVIDGEMMSTELGTYSMLSAIIKADVNRELSGELLICCLLWIGKIIFGKSHGSKQIKEIVKLLCSVLGTAQVPSSANTIDEFVCMIDSFANGCTKLSDKQLNGCVEAARKGIESKKDYAVATLGIFFIGLVNCYASYTTPLSSSFVQKISALVGSCFANGSSEVILRMAYVMRLRFSEEVYRRLATTDQNTIFCSLSGALSKKVDRYRTEAVCFYCWVIPLTALTTISSQLASVIDILQQSFDHATVSLELLQALKFLIVNDITPIGPCNKQHSALEVLKAATHCDDIGEVIRAIINKLDPSCGRTLCELLVKSISPSSATMSNMTLLKIVARETKAVHREIPTFTDALGELCINILTNDGNPCTAIANEILKDM